MLRLLIDQDLDQVILRGLLYRAAKWMSGRMSLSIYLCSVIKQVDRTPQRAEPRQGRYR
jgi:hypothetical protein